MTASVPEEERGATSASEHRKLFLGGLKCTETEESVSEHFSRFGVVEAVLIPKNKVTGRPRGFGFVTFKDEDTARLLGADPAHMCRSFNGRHLDIKPAVPRPMVKPTENSSSAYEEESNEEVTPEMAPNRVFVGGLPDGVTNNSLKEYFQEFGTVADSFVLMHPVTKRPRGFGFITFKEKEVLTRVLSCKTHIIAGKKVETRLATKRSNKPPMSGSVRTQSQSSAQGYPVQPQMMQQNNFPVNQQYYANQLLMQNMGNTMMMQHQNAAQMQYQAQVQNMMQMSYTFHHNQQQQAQFKFPAAYTQVGQEPAPVRSVTHQLMGTHMDTGGMCDQSSSVKGMFTARTSN